jgi:hypothetical protein
LEGGKEGRKKKMKSEGRNVEETMKVRGIDKRVK